MDAYRGRKALVTGGLGFVGSNLAIRLVELGADVTVLDVLWPDHGGNLFNIYPVRHNLKLNICDIRDKRALDILVKDADFVFHLAGQCSHVLGQIDPYPDIDINIHGTAVLMESVKASAPDAVTVFTSTRGVYGTVVQLPAAEDAATNPKGLYELSNLAAEKLINFYHDVHGLRTVNLRLSNIYGERSQMLHSKFGVVNWFVRLAMEGKTIQVFGGGGILRDFLYVDDCVEAILRTAASEGVFGETFNVGSDRRCTILDLVKTIVGVAGSGGWESAPFTAERAAQEPGDFYPDITKIKEASGWAPATGLQEGLKRTLDYYRAHRDMYWQREPDRKNLIMAGGR